MYFVILLFNMYIYIIITVFTFLLYIIIFLAQFDLFVYIYILFNSNPFDLLSTKFHPFNTLIS